jgi:hypothetical protein
MARPHFPDPKDVLADLDALWDTTFGATLIRRMLVGPKYEMGVAPVSIVLRRIRRLKTDEEFAAWLSTEASDVNRAIVLQGYLTLREKLDAPDDELFPSAVAELLRRTPPLRNVIQTSLEVLARE